MLTLETGVSSLQGHRYNMEDEHVIIEDLNKDINKEGNTAPFQAFFGVYDGHCGRAAAEFARDHLHNNLVQLPVITDSTNNSDALSVAVRDAFKATDKAFLEWAHKENNDAGCTAIAALLREDKVFVGNLGDARCVLSRGGKAIDLSQDHKPSRDDEKERILKAGGFVVNNRINSFLAVSRAIGDRDYKNWGAKKYFEDDLVSAVADVHVQQLDPTQDDYLILACDGVWDVMSSQDVVTFVRNTAAQIVEEEEKKKAAALNDGVPTTTTNASATPSETNEDLNSSTNSNDEEGYNSDSTDDSDYSPQNMDDESKSITQKICDRLTREAIKRGSSDNVTAVVVKLSFT